MALDRIWSRHEPLLVLVALPPLVLRERFPPWAQALALAWLALPWLARRARTGRWTVPTVLDPVALALLCTLPGTIHAATQSAPDVGLAAAVSRAESLVFAMALAYAMANWVRTPRRAWLAAGGLLLASLALVAFGLVGVDWLPKVPALSPLLDRLPRLVGAVPHATLPAYGQAAEVTIHPNSVAALAILFVPLALACLAWPARSPRDDTPTPSAPPSPAPSPPPPAVLGERVGGWGPAGAPPRWLRPLAAAALAATLPFLVLTQSRGAWLGLAAAMVGMAAVRWKPVRAALAGAGATAVVLAALVGPAQIVARIAAGGLPGAESAGGRLRLWQEALALVHAHPVWGIGLNTFVVVHGRRPEYGGAYVYQGAPHAHNTLLQAALDYGLPGFVAVVGLYAALFAAAWRAHRRLAGTPLDAVVTGLAFGLLAHAAHGLVDAVAIGGKIGFVPWALAGALAGIRARAHRWVGEASVTGQRPVPASPS